MLIFLKLRLEIFWLDKDIGVKFFLMGKNMVWGKEESFKDLIFNVDKMC